MDITFTQIIQIAAGVGTAVGAALAAMYAKQWARQTRVVADEVGSDNVTSGTSLRASVASLESKFSEMVLSMKELNGLVRSVEKNVNEIQLDTARREGAFESKISLLAAKSEDYGRRLGTLEAIYHTRRQGDQIPPS